MIQKLTIDSLSPLQCQLLVLIGLLRDYLLRLPWRALREVLRASCGSARPNDAALDAAYRELDAKGILYSIPRNGSPLVWVNVPIRSPNVCQRAAAAFGPVDFPATLALVRQLCPELANETDADGKPDARDAARDLEYLADILDGELFAAHLDAAAEAFGFWPSEYDYGIRGEGPAKTVCNWPAPIPSPIAELRLPWDLDNAFKKGKPAGAILGALAAAMPRHAALRCGIAARYLAPLLVWAGRGDLLALCGGARPKRNDGGTGPADEDAIASVAFARSFFGNGRQSAVPGAGKLFDNGGIAQKALVALNAAKFPPPKPTLMQTIAELSGRSRSRSPWRWERESKPTFPSDGMALRFFLAGAEAAWATDGLMEEGIPPGTPPLAWLGRTMAHALSKDAAMRTSFPEAPQALAAAEKAAADGWAFLAAQLGGLLAQYPEFFERALALAAAPADEPLLWSRTETAKPWDPILDRLGEALSDFQRATRTAASAKAKTADELLVADLCLFTAGGANGGESVDAPAFHLRVIQPALAKRRRDGSFSRPENACTWRALRKALVAHSAGLSQETTVALDAWIRREQPHYGNEAHAMDIDGPGRNTLLEILLGAGGDASLRALVDAKAVVGPEIEIHDFELVTKNEPDGSFTFSLPALAWLAEDNPLLVRVEPSRFIWWRMPDTLRPFFGLLRDAKGTRDGIRIPAGGAAKARAMLLDAAKAGLPVRGAITPAGEGSSLKSVAGGARLAARLDRLDGSLRLLLRVRPVPEEPELLFPPGRGKAEIVVTTAKKPFMLVRDRAAEDAAAEVVRSALSDFDGEREGENEWIVEGPERELALLEALRAASGATTAGLDVEWRAPKRERTKVKEVSSANLEGSKGADWWLGVTGEFRLDDGERVALRDLIAALPRRVGGYIPLGERAWVRLSAELRRRLEALAAAGTVRGGELRVSPAALPMLEAAFAKDGNAAACDAPSSLPALPAVLADAAGRISAALAEDHPVPEGLAARLRPYQGEGYEWLARLAACGLGGCLADDMGLGKTVQLLALLLARAGDGPSLVVAPASVCGN